MSTATFVTEQEPLVLHFQPIMKKLSDEEFYEFCRANDHWRIERTAEGDVIIMPPTGGKTGIRNFKLIGQFFAWIEADQTGEGFDSSTIFALPNGAQRSPDLAWVSNKRWQALTEEQQETFPPLCPDFVVELRSRTDRLKRLEAKMQEYIDNGAELGWLIDPVERRVHIYRRGASAEILDNPQTVSGAPLLSGFTLDMQTLWD
ncbi:MAG TPA: Uma2 family endonuclease [Pyrinomonadaceae bacterium]|jgi:Uma2 family endonuclease|nr:Uma2 family endonuclease [Pyrinomonadaceae bacterium]